MVWFKQEIDYARESLKQASESAIERAGDRLGEEVRVGIAGASGELRQVVTEASREVDAKLERISDELHHQRSFTKTDVKELVDYAADKLAATIDQRVEVMKSEIATLVDERVDYFKQEVDSFFVRRQKDLARERRRLMANVMIAVSASILMGVVSLMYQRVAQYHLDLYALFRILFASLIGGYGAYLAISLIRRYHRMSEHEKDVVYVSMRYWGVLRPESLFGHLMLLLLLALVLAALFFPEGLARLSGNQTLMEWAARLRGG